MREILQLAITTHSLSHMCVWEPSDFATVSQLTFHPTATTFTEEVDDVMHIESQYLFDVDLVVITVVGVVLVHRNVDITQASLCQQEP